MSKKKIYLIGSPNDLKQILSMKKQLEKEGHKVTLSPGLKHGNQE